VTMLGTRRHGGVGALQEGLQGSRWCLQQGFPLRGAESDAGDPLAVAPGGPDADVTGAGGPVQPFGEEIRYRVVNGAFQDLNLATVTEDTIASSLNGSTRARARRPATSSSTWRNPSTGTASVTICSAARRRRPRIASWHGRERGAFASFSKSAGHRSRRGANTGACNGTRRTARPRSRSASSRRTSGRGGTRTRASGGVT
jgi:hypothetical protein